MIEFSVKPYLETWEHQGDVIVATGDDSHDPSNYRAYVDCTVLPVPGYIAAAPDMCRALLAAEWGGHDADYGAHCPACGAITQFSGANEHDAGCTLDAALTKAGLDTQEKRDAARKEMGI